MDLSNWTYPYICVYYSMSLLNPLLLNLDTNPITTKSRRAKALFYILFGIPKEY
jgi:hypothetical protein